MLSFKPTFSLSSFTFIKSQEALYFFTFCHKGGVFCISVVIDISPSDLDSSLCFLQPSVSHCTQYASKFGKLSSVQRTRKGQFLYQSQRKAMQKIYSNYHTIALISQASKIMLKILQARLQQYVNHEFSSWF